MGGLIAKRIGGNRNYARLLPATEQPDFRRCRDVIRLIWGISPRTRARYIGPRRHLVDFMRGMNASPRVALSPPVWGDGAIDFVTFESQILGIDANTIRFEIPSLWFGRLLVGMPDFTEGGGCCAQVLRGVSCQNRISRKTPATLPIIARLGPLEDGQRRLSGGVRFAALVGFCFLFRVCELAALKRRDAAMRSGRDGVTAIRIELRLS